MVHIVEPNGRCDAREGVRGAIAGTEARQECTRVALALHKGVQRVAVGLDGGDDHSAVLIGELRRLADDLGAARDGRGEDGARVSDGEGDILHAVAVAGQVRRHVIAQANRHARVERGGEGELDAALAHDVRHHVAAARLQAAVGDGREAEAGDIPASSLLGVANPGGWRG